MTGSQAMTLAEQDFELTLEELARSCACSTGWVIELVHQGALEPLGQAPEEWRFAAVAIHRARIAWHLTRDLQVNAAGAALVLELLDEVQALRHTLDVR